MVHPLKAACKSSMLGIGYETILAHALYVMLKSPQIRISSVSLFMTGTIGAAHGA